MYSVVQFHAFLKVCILGILHNCWHFCTLTFPLLASPVRLTDLTPAGKTEVAPNDQDTPSCAAAAPRAHGQSFFGAALSFATVSSNRNADNVSSAMSPIFIVQQWTRRILASKKNLKIPTLASLWFSGDQAHKTFMVFVKLGASCFCDSWKFMSQNKTSALVFLYYHSSKYVWH